MKGWWQHPVEHGLAARGIPTTILNSGLKHKEFNKYNKEAVKHLINGVVSQFDCSELKKWSQKDRKDFYEYYFRASDLDYDIFNKFIMSGKKLFEIKKISLVGSRAEGTFQKDSDMDILVVMDLTKDGLDLFSDVEDLEYYIEKREEELMTMQTKWKFLKDNNGKKIPVDIFFSVNLPHNKDPMKDVIDSANNLYGKALKNKNIEYNPIIKDGYKIEVHIMKSKKDRGTKIDTDYWTKLGKTPSSKDVIRIVGEPWKGAFVIISKIKGKK